MSLATVINPAVQLELIQQQSTEQNEALLVNQLVPYSRNLLKKVSEVIELTDEQLLSGLIVNYYQVAKNLSSVYELIKGDVLKAARENINKNCSEVMHNLTDDMNIFNNSLYPRITRLYSAFTQQEEKEF